MSEVVVRLAVDGDADAVARVQVQGWHEAFTGRIPQSVLDGLDVAQRAPQWRRAIAGEWASPGSGVWVAETGGAVIGFASVGASLDDDAEPGRLQLYAIYVLAAHYGSGAGQGLLDASIGDAAASLWTLDGPSRTKSFYLRNGFAPDGAVKDDAAWGEVIREVRLTRPAQR